VTLGDHRQAQQILPERSRPKLRQGARRGRRGPEPGCQVQ